MGGEHISKSLPEGFLAQDRILFDYFSITWNDDCASPLSFMDILGIDRASFIAGRGGGHSYVHRDYFEGISIMYGGRDEVWLEMTGKGCRAFETYGSGDWQALFDLTRDRHFHLTRLDVAYDDFSGRLPILDVYHAIDPEYKELDIVSKSRWWKLERSSQGVCCYLGSPQSDLRIRVYDKAAEQGYDIHWTRFELQLRDEHAQAFVDRIGGDAGKCFLGVLSHFCRVVVPSDDDTNRSRWPTADFWARFVDGVQKISLYAAPGQLYTLDKLKRYVGQFGAAAGAYAAVVGADEFLSQIDSLYKGSRNPQYGELVAALGGDSVDEFRYIPAAVARRSGG